MKRGGRSTVVACGALILCLLGMAPASADRASKTDAEDSPGLLDIARVAHGHRDGRLVHRIRTHEPWPARRLDRDTRWIVFWISTNDRPRQPEGFERLIWIHYARGRLRGAVYQPSTTDGYYGPHERVGKVRVTRPDARTVVVRFEARLLDENLRNYRWWAQTSWETERGPCAEDGMVVDNHNGYPFSESGTCFDRGPGGGYLRHRL